MPRFAAALAAVAALAVVGQAAAATDKLPDLRMAKLANLHITYPSTGQRLLRYDAVIVNVGTGRFEARGIRPDTSTSQMTVTQRVYDDAGGYRDVSSPASMFYAGDGHNHWHVEGLEVAQFSRLSDGVQVGTLAKHGFCFYDNVAFRLSLPGSPSSPYYTNCGTSSSLSVLMGLSVGWGDRYPWNIAYQYIDITGIPPGKYRLRSTVDPVNQFLESDDSNNYTWVDLQLGAPGQYSYILGYGPYA